MEMPSDQARELAELRRRHLRVAFACGAFVGAMLAMSFAAGPLYHRFCRTADSDATPLSARSARREEIERKIMVRFDANVAPGLGWNFMPGQREVEIKVGETLLVYYVAQNIAAQESI